MRNPVKPQRPAPAARPEIEQVTVLLPKKLPIADAELDLLEMELADVLAEILQDR